MDSKPESTPQYNRILLKISGESLMGERQFGLDPAMVNRVASEIATIVERLTVWSVPLQIIWGC
jgi:uridylate kinase